MSIAVAVRTTDQIVLATDSKRTFGGGAVPVDNLRDVKIRRVGGAYIATTGWGVYTNILEDYLRGARQPRLVDSASIFTFFRNFWKALHQRYAFVNDQCSETDSPFGDLDASFLVVAASGIFYVACDMSVTEFDQYYAVGSGAGYALGAMHALYGGKNSAELVARRAVAAATALDIYCGGEVNLVTLRARHAPIKSRR
jgi:ATP-dependent protease HslVU (ClpYQ) peptidase subunit